MFLTEKILGIILKAKEEAYILALGAKEVELKAIKEINIALSEALRYERARADGLVDRLLVRDAKVAAVSPAAIEIAKVKDEQAIKKFREIFDGLNDIGAEVPPKEYRAFDMAGGSAVAPSAGIHSGGY